MLKEHSRLDNYDQLPETDLDTIKIGRHVKKDFKVDIDLIDYKGQMLNLKEVSIPHPRAHLRNFVLFPLQEICPDWLHPVYNKKIDFFIKKLSFKLRNEITRIKDSVII